MQQKNNEAYICDSVTDETLKAYKNVRISGSNIGRLVTVGDDTIIKNSTISECCEIERRNLIRDSRIGKCTYTGANTYIMWAEVGAFCNFSRNIDIGGNEHNYHALSMMSTYKFTQLTGGTYVEHPREESITIGNDVWIGVGATILRKKGLIIGDGAIIGAGAVVTKSIPPYAIAVGVPAKVKGYRFHEDTIKKLLKIQWWNWDLSKIKENWEVLSGTDTDKLNQFLN